MRWSDLCLLVEALKTWSGHDPDVLIQGREPVIYMEPGYTSFIELAPDGGFYMGDDE